MDLSTLTAISPVDGRYRASLSRLSAYFSEYALIRYRIITEVEYFIALSGLGLFGLTATARRSLRRLYGSMTPEDAWSVKAYEAETNHDVKAVEYHLRRSLEGMGLGHLREFVHFGLTSQDVNNTAVPMLWRDAVEQVYLPEVTGLCLTLRRMADDWRDVPMLARTHGQPASPTRLGKELMVFVERLEGQLARLREVPYGCKFGGATGNFNAHVAAYPAIDWPGFADRFCRQRLGLRRQRHTTQIEHYDDLAAQFDAMRRVNTVLIDLCRDLWTYVSMEYFRQVTRAGEVGSSAMPHKVNPIDFENAEGNLGIANALFGHLSEKLPVSRLQRDLTDSTVLRNIGVPFAHTVLAISAIGRGLGKLVLNGEALHRDLDANWAVVAEAIQTILRREGYPNPYDALKALTRGRRGVTRDSIHAFVDTLRVTDAVKAELKAVTPFNYTGVLP